MPYRPMVLAPVPLSKRRIGGKSEKVRHGWEDLFGKALQSSIKRLTIQARRARSLGVCDVLSMAVFVHRHGSAQSFANSSTKDASIKRASQARLKRVTESFVLPPSRRDELPNGGQSIESSEG
jgi:hypothetical protein